LRDRLNEHSLRQLRQRITVRYHLNPLRHAEVGRCISGTKSSNSTDGGTSSRVFGSFISWMSQKKSPVFVVATANDVGEGGGVGDSNPGIWPQSQGLRPG
jgi:hypothetical protein